MAESNVTIKYEHAGPGPIFVIASWTDQPWQPLELEQRTDGEFSRTFSIKPGTYYYKFRLGHGDWFIADDLARKETDEAGNVNNVLVVSAPETTGVSQQKSKPSTSDHSPGSSLGCDGVDNDSDENHSRSLRKAEAPSEKSMADFHGANGDIECEQPDQAAAAADVDDPAHKMNGLGTNGSISKTNQKDPVTTSDTAADTSHHPVDKEANGPDAQESVSQKSVVSQGMVASMSSMLCGKRRKLFAVALTALMIPVVAWKLRT